MDKKVPDTGKNKDVRQDVLSPAADFSQVTVGAYNPELTAQKLHEKQPWNASPQGRVAIRVFSRGIMGAAFFTAGGLLNRKWMHEERFLNGKLVEDYRGGKYDATKPFSQQDNPLKFIAKLIDTLVGKPVEATVRVLTGNEPAAKNAVRFRPTKFKDAELSRYLPVKATKSEAVKAARFMGRAAITPEARKEAFDAIRKARAIELPPIYRGRSLGNEVVAVTFDFFCASIGDALGRDIANFVDPNVRNSSDPNVRQKWLDDKGHIKPLEAAKAIPKTLWRYVTYNGGEDWAVAIPYVYFMKGHRALVNHFSPGFQYDFDRNLNGGSFKLDKENHVTGNYNMAGIADLQHRFVVYNMGTLMYRELYDYTARKLQGKNAVLYGAPDKDTSRMSLGEKTADVFKWLARGIIKAGIYMTPAVPFFWITRTPQTKHRGVFVGPDNGVLSYENPKTKTKVDAEKAEHRKNGGGPRDNKTYRKYETVYANEMHQGIITADTPVYRAEYRPDPRKSLKGQFTPTTPFMEGKYNPITREGPYDRSYNAVDAVFNTTGHLNYKLANSLDGVASWAETHGGRASAKIKQTLAIKDFKRFTHPFVYASTSYTPYMYAKAEFANLWDNGKTDLATERLIDGAASFNWSEFKAGAGEIWRSILHKPFLDPGRELEAERRVKLDTSQPDAVNRGDADVRTGQVEKQPNWRERVVQGRPEDRPEIGANRPKSYKEQEEMREALREMQPPTNSVN